MLEAIKISREIGKLQQRLRELLEDDDDATALLAARAANRGKKGFSISETRKILGL